jgi:hypothetical protein
MPKSTPNPEEKKEFKIIPSPVIEEKKIAKPAIDLSLFAKKTPSAPVPQPIP